MEVGTLFPQRDIGETGRELGPLEPWLRWLTLDASSAYETQAQK